MRGNSGKRWSVDEVLMLRRLIAEDVEPADIADVIGRTPDAIRHMRHRLRDEQVPELRCPRCQRVRPASQFWPSQRHTGGYCASCSRAYQRRTEQGEALDIGGQRSA